MCALDYGAVVVYDCFMCGRSDAITEDVLRGLYLTERLTEAQIGAQFGLSQVTVGRLRKKWGIPTITKSERLQFPALTTPQTSLLLGTMLGDGGLNPTGSTTARLEESHSSSQRAYLDWKAALWGVFVAGITPTRKGVHTGWRLTTHGCREFRPYWELFYPTQKGAKTFVGMPVEGVDDFALAVWFMDDGSRSAESFRLHVGPRPDDQAIQLRILRRFGLSPRIYPDEGDTTIHLSGRRDITRFLDLVSPHVPVCMSYKLELPVLRMRGEAPRDKLTAERLTELLSRGLSPQQIASIMKVGVTSVRRAIRKQGVPFVPVRGRPSKQTGLTLEGARELLTQDDVSVEQAVDILRRIPIPIPQRSPDELAKDAARLQRSSTQFNGESFTGISYAGSWLCDHCFPYRYDARYKEQPSLRQAWYDPKFVEQAIQFQRRVGDPITPQRVLRALQVVVRAPTNFRPSLVRALVRYYLPQGGLVLDPCAGYGGRAAGTWAAGSRYVGVEPHPEAIKAYGRLASLLKTSAITLHPGAFEDVDLGDLVVDLVFTSPPYFSVERYADDTQQSWVRYPYWDGWVRGFLRPFVEKSWDHLRPGGRFVLNTKNLSRGKYPILDVARVEAQRVGFVLELDGQLPLGRLGKDLKTEPLLVYRKPSCTPPGSSSYATSLGSPTSSS